jgi:hypothetical protein
MVDKVQEIAQRDKEADVEVIRQEMRDLTRHFNLYNEVVSEEVKINETLRYKQRLIIHKLKDDILELKRIMAVPRLYSKYVESSRSYHKKKKEGEILPQKEVDLYDLSSDRSTPYYKQHRSMVKNLNDKSRVSLPNAGKSVIDLNTSDEDDGTSMLNKLDYVPINLTINGPPNTFSPKSNIERHNELVKELKGSRNKPSILGQYKSVLNLNTTRVLPKKFGNITERSGLKPGSLERKIESSTDFSDQIFSKELNFPKTMKQKKLFGQMKTNHSLPQLKNINKDIMNVTKESKRY